jgi:uncharacterized Tic20 family protein
LADPAIVVAPNVIASGVMRTAGEDPDEGHRLRDAEDGVGLFVRLATNDDVELSLDRASIVRRAPERQRYVRAVRRKEKGARLTRARSAAPRARPMHRNQSVIMPMKFPAPSARRSPMTCSLTIPSRPTQNERLAAVIAHAGTCVAWFLAPLLVYLFERDRSSFVSRQALQALLWSAFGTVVSFATCGAAIPIFLCVHLYAALQTYKGRDFEYPLIGAVVQSLTRH